VVSAVIEEVPVLAPEAVDQADGFASLVVRLVHLAGGRIETWAFETVALVLVREGALDAAGVSFGCDYDLNIRSRELRRGYVRAVDIGWLIANGREMWLGREPAGTERPADETREEAAAIARSVLELPRAELERCARHLLLAE